MTTVHRACAWFALLAMCCAWPIVHAMSPVIHCQLDAPTKSFVVLEPPRYTKQSINTNSAETSQLVSGQSRGKKRNKFIPQPVPQWAAKVRWRPDSKSGTHVWVMNGDEDTFVRKEGVKVTWFEYHGGVHFATFEERSMSAGQRATESVPGMYTVGDRLPVAHLFDAERNMHILLNSTGASWKTSLSAEWGTLGHGKWQTMPPM